MQVTDPVCGMPVESDKAFASETFEVRAYYFCPSSCHDQFRKSPERYAKKEEAKPVSPPSDTGPRR